MISPKLLPFIQIEAVEKDLLNQAYVLLAKKRSDYYQHQSTLPDKNLIDRDQDLLREMKLFSPKLEKFIEDNENRSYLGCLDLAERLYEDYTTFKLNPNTLKMDCVDIRDNSQGWYISFISSDHGDKAQEVIKKGTGDIINWGQVYCSLPYDVGYIVNPYSIRLDSGVISFNEGYLRNYYISKIAAYLSLNK